MTHILWVWCILHIQYAVLWRVQGLQFSVVPVITEQNSCGLDHPIMSLTSVLSQSVLSCNSTQYGSNHFWFCLPKSLILSYYWNNRLISSDYNSKWNLVIKTWLYIEYWLSWILKGWRVWQWCCWRCKSSEMLHAVGWVVPYVLRNCNALIFRSNHSSSECQEQCHIPRTWIFMLIL